MSKRTLSVLGLLLITAIMAYTAMASSAILAEVDQISSSSSRVEVVR